MKYNLTNESTDEEIINAARAIAYKKFITWYNNLKAEIINELKDVNQTQDAHDMIHEMIDSAVPIYYHDQIQMVEIEPEILEIASDELCVDKFDNIIALYPAAIYMWLSNEISSEEDIQSAIEARETA